jgi:hypothetical protein
MVVPQLAALAKLVLLVVSAVLVEGTVIPRLLGAKGGTGSRELFTLTVLLLDGPREPTFPGWILCEPDAPGDLHPRRVPDMQLRSHEPRSRRRHVCLRHALANSNTFKTTLSNVGFVQFTYGLLDADGTNQDILFGLTPENNLAIAQSIDLTAGPHVLGGAGWFPAATPDDGIPCAHDPSALGWRWTAA